MVSFLQFGQFRDGCKRGTNPGVILTTRDNDGVEITLWRQCDHRFTDTYLMEVNSITVREVGHVKGCFYQADCFKMLVSFHTQTTLPQRLSSGLYNCSVDYYWRFQRHLDCNLKVECEGGRDETEHCPFSSPACQGWIASRTKCFRYVSKEAIQRLDSDETNVYTRAALVCVSMNASLGVPVHMEDLLKVFLPLKNTHTVYFRYVAVGLFSGGLSVDSAYRKGLITHDRTVLYLTRFLIREYEYLGEKVCFSYVRSSFIGEKCSADTPSNTLSGTICEIPKQHGEDYNRSSAIINFPTITSAVRLRAGLTRCPSGQLTFLPCNGNNTSLPWFSCDDAVTRVYYTLVCDFRQDCHDRSDESFCKHPPCDGFSCSSGQCVSYSKRCNIVSDCMDDSDEIRCFHKTKVSRKGKVFFFPAIVHFNGKDSFVLRGMKPNTSCPNTHYRCLDRYKNCLPVYTRCNGWFDCLDHKDEEGCEDITCPGYYRCFNSTVCLHTDHLCDSWPHCPQRDDEWFCDVTCPAQCLCQGHAFVCSGNFSVHQFPQLRYLNAEGSGLALLDVTNHQYIVHLILRWCSLAYLSLVKVPNLQILDLSRNALQTVNMDIFVGLTNLRSLSLAENPLSELVRPSSFVQQTTLKAIDLSHTKLNAFDCHNLSSFYYLQHINLSFSSLQTLTFDSFRCTPHLSELYLKGSPVKNFPLNVFKLLSHLRMVSADNYKLCCKQILPAHSLLITCDAPKKDLSSCEDLLQSGLYRTFLWLVCILCLLGNVLCFVMRVCVQSGVMASGFHVFVSNLSMADLLMGIYIVIIGVADEMFRGNYLHYDEMWTQSVACKVAGFLSLLSSEVSALTIWLITLDRFIVLRFPFSRVRFQRTSAAVACLFTWFIGCLLAFIPLLPVTSHWEFYSQTGICIPLPVTGQDFKGRAYSVSVFIVLNFVLFLFITTGQAFIYWSVQKNAMKTETTKSATDLTIARRLISVAMTDFLCWFPIGLCGLLASADTPISGEVNVALAIFVLPLNSALNPFVYTFNTLMEKRRKSKEATLLRWLEKHSDLLDRL